ncbi:hypothetical protein DERP_004294 [Dermatophagoides pteronyssinus]|uniref:Uncharacterized protein n=1 Tax=Dermatophagoides pteronyssinus TaxID=6956 RepID=A0ABQ8JNN0_DERPT|nr:hypothetical protein DERP_004294 [Dermatophagoides pteronyssinus]
MIVIMNEKLNESSEKNKIEEAQLSYKTTKKTLIFIHNDHKYYIGDHIGYYYYSHISFNHQIDDDDNEKIH